MTAPYLVVNPPHIRQFRSPRRATPTGLIVVHTAESAPDEHGPDDGTVNVARFIRDRDTYGSYHWLADSDSRLQLVPYDAEAYGDGTGSNPFAIHVSAATQAHRWPTLAKAWRDGCVRQMAEAAAESARWLEAEHGITVPARRVTRAESDWGVAGFIAHGDRDPGRRTDPGAAFPWDVFLRHFRSLTQEDRMTPAQERKLDGLAKAVTSLAEMVEALAEGNEAIKRRITKSKRDVIAAVKADES